MQALTTEMILVLVALLGFGSSLIHYSAYAKARAKVQIKKESID